MEHGFLPARSNVVDRHARAYSSSNDVPVREYGADETSEIHDGQVPFSGQDHALRPFVYQSYYQNAMAILTENCRKFPVRRALMAAYHPNLLHTVARILLMFPPSSLPIIEVATRHMHVVSPPNVLPPPF